MDCFEGKKAGEQSRYIEQRHERNGIRYSQEEAGNGKSDKEEERPREMSLFPAMHRAHFRTVGRYKKLYFRRISLGGGGGGGGELRPSEARRML